MNRMNRPSYTVATLLASFCGSVLLVSLTSGETATHLAGHGPAGVCPYLDADREMWRCTILSMARTLDRVSSLLHAASEELTQLAGDDLATVPGDSTAR